ncbi:LapA family protein [Anabaena sp. FACHB-1237]|uniref:LapA family protein n=1 Tax=Anabaena sp. FACHB-1237 TaxID=2692769 RepID=UPI00168087AD|nr:LapA family protein [Anabaena sp. FACHB-1237]MBD2136697.1 LapA family protein [Anabaena sp. FACHB-1237]
MNLFRSIILFTLLGGLIIFLFQNLSPSLALVFLGMRSKQLPLGVWILFSLTAGIITSLVITNLLKLTTFNNIQASQTKVTPTRASSEKSARTSSNFTSSVNQEEDNFDDWENRDDEEEWEIKDNYRTSGRTLRTSADEPRSSSVYSYSSQSPENTGVGKTEMIYDANYRVIIPPADQRISDINNQDDEDDWSFFEDDENDDFDDVKSRKS